MKYNYLFNFSVSYIGGGFKRLHDFARWFHHNGGASFIIHPACNNISMEFPNNKYMVVQQSNIKRAVDDCYYLKGIMKNFQDIDLYYSYGIPIYKSIAKVNWFHLSNTLPLWQKNVPLSIVSRIKFFCLGLRIKNNFKNADVISAESKFSLSLVDPKYQSKLFLSVNGSDDEIRSRCLICRPRGEKNLAVVVGTYSYKKIKDSIKIFKMLKRTDDKLKLVIVGDERNIPPCLGTVENVDAVGLVPRKQVIELLKRAKYYISTTCIENSYNAAAEGVFFAEESFISDIGPHRELLDGCRFDIMAIPDIGLPVLRVKREDLIFGNLRSWDEVIEDMIDHVIECLHDLDSTD